MELLDGALGWDKEDDRRRNHPSEKDRWFMDKVPCPYRGDEDGPPLAWTTLWGDKYSNVCGGYIDDEMRQWGYVFWDAERVQAESSSGAKEVLERQWSRCWSVRSPERYFERFRAYL
jgi:hypothetical protein